MSTLITGLVVFIGVHLVPTMTGVRAGLADRLGRVGYQVLFSLASLAGFGLIVLGYGEARGLARANPQLWIPPAWGRHVTLTLMLPAIILLVAAFVPSRIRDVVGHPMLTAIKLWALGHLFVRGDLASVLVFGSLLAYAVYDRISVKRRDAPGPFGTRKGVLGGDVTAVLVGMLLYGGLLFGLHGYLIGVPLLAVRVAP